MNHLAFEDKPVITSSRKAAQQKKTNAFFSDSDEEETQEIDQKKSSPYCGRYVYAFNLLTNYMLFRP